MESESVVDIVEAIILILIVLGVFTLILYHPVRRFFRRRAELKENQIEKEAYLSRSLTPEEIEKLNLMIKSVGGFSPSYIVGFIIVLIYTFTNLSPRLPGATSNSHYISLLLLLIPILITVAIIYENREKAKKMKQDLTSQVNKVPGKVYKESHGNRYSSDLLVTVRGITFNGKQKLSSGAMLFDEVNQDQEVVIEYSPNSKYVWKIQSITVS